MKAYTDIFGKPLERSDVAAATRLIIRSGKVSPSLLQRGFKWGYGKAARVIEVLGDAKVVGPVTNKPRIIILNNEEQAVNAALRQLKKGSKQ